MTMKSKKSKIPPYTRHGDPWTSHAAAQRLRATLTLKRKDVYEVLYQYPEGLPHHRLPAALSRAGIVWPTTGRNGVRSTARSRCNELVKDYRLVINSGRTELFEGSDCVIWVCVDHVRDKMPPPPLPPPPLPLDPSPSPSPSSSTSIEQDNGGRRPPEDFW
jgi:hypothetical protein